MSVVTLAIKRAIGYDATLMSVLISHQPTYNVSTTLSQGVSSGLRSGWRCGVLHETSPACSGSYGQLAVRTRKHTRRVKTSSRVENINRRGVRPVTSASFARNQGENASYNYPCRSEGLESCISTRALLVACLELPKLYVPRRHRRRKARATIGSKGPQTHIEDELLRGLVSPTGRCSANGVNFRGCVAHAA